jgi:hypothetical protein
MNDNESHHKSVREGAVKKEEEKGNLHFKINPNFFPKQEGNGFDSWWGQESSLFNMVSRPTAGPTKPSIQWLLGVYSPGVMQQGHDVNNSPPSSVEVKNGGTVHPLPHALL